MAGGEKDWRDAALRPLVRWSLAFLTVSFALFAVAPTSSNTLLAAYAVTYACVAIAAALPLGQRRNRIALVVVGLFWTFFPFIRLYGVTLGMPLALIGASVLVHLFYDYRWGHAVTLAGASLFLGTAALIAFGGFVPANKIGAELEHPLVWVRFAFTFAAGATLITGGVRFAVRRAEKQLAATEDALARLERERAERINAEEARARAERTAQEVQHREALGRLASGIAHDFNNTLTVVLSWAELLHARAQRDGAAGDAKMVEGLGAIVHTAEHAGQFTRQLLSFARREPGPSKRLALTSIVRETMRALERALPNTIHVGLDLVDVPEIYADEAQVGQVLFNLVLNGRDAMPEGGTLSVGTSAVLDDRGERRVALVVRDTGTGMTPEVIARIFDPFFTTKGEKGTGLGLASVRDIVTKWGGTVKVDSTPGVGSTFTVTFPVAPLVSRVNLTEEAATVPVVIQARILVADDNAEVRSAMAQALRDAGADVFEASTGPEILDVVRAQGPMDLVCCDSVMPGMTAESIVPSIRGVAPRTPILFCSGNPEQSIPSNDDDASVSWLPKPVGQHALVKKARDVLIRARGVHVLVVDDDPIVRAVAAGLLDELLCSSTALATGDEVDAALSRAAQGEAGRVDHARPEPRGEERRRGVPPAA